MNAQEQRAFAYKVTQFVWLIFGLMEGLLGLRFLLKLIGANPNSPVSALIYGITSPLLAPFHAMVGQPQVGDVVFEPVTLIAMLIYALLAWVIIRAAVILLYPLTNRSGRPRADTDGQPASRDPRQQETH